MGGIWVHNGSHELDEKSKYKEILGVTLSLTILMSIIVSLRAYVRSVILKSVGTDDYAIFLGAIFTICYTGLCIGQTKWGLGLEGPERPAQNLGQFSVLNFAGKPIYVAGLLMFKVSLCLSYLRILTHSSKRYRQIVWGVLYACIAGHLAGILVLIFLCNPIEKSWKPNVPGTCIPNVNSIYGLGAISIFFDIIILILPIPMVIRLQINNRKKVGLCGVFTLGMFTTFCSIMRLVQVKTILKNGDVTGLVLWATVEMTVGTTLTCLPTLLPLLKYYNDKKLTTPHNNSYNLENTRRNHLGFVKTAEGSANDTSPGWQDRDSMDNSSQKKILGLESALEEVSGDERLHTKPRRMGDGILATTEVQVHRGKATDDDVQRATERMRGGDW